MRRMMIDYVQPDMVVARAIYYDGKVLLVKGSKLNEKYIQRLREVGFRSIYVEDFIADKDVVDLITDRTRLDAMSTVKNSYKALERKASLNMKEISSSVNYILDEVLSSREVLLNLADIHSHDDYLLAHATGVCVLSLATGLAMGFTPAQMKELGVGALLHDIGMVGLDPAIINKPSNLTPEETAAMQQHPTLGFEILRKYAEVSTLSAHVAFQHHEKWRGGGYPRDMKGEEIHIYARIASVADVFDALLSDRPYRNGYTNSQALTIISRMSSTYFDPFVFEAFASKIAIFPVGTIVKLNTGETAIVLEVRKKHPGQPLVKLLTDQFAMQSTQLKDVDLVANPSVFIVGVDENYNPS